MKYNLIISRKYVDDLEDIRQYIVNNLSNETSAQKISNNLLLQIEKLQEFPYIGTPLTNLYPTNKPYRYLVLGNYITFYHIIKENVYIDRVVYGRRDYKYLFKDMG